VVVHVVALLGMCAIIGGLAAAFGQGRQSHVAVGGHAAPAPAAHPAPPLPPSAPGAPSAPAAFRGQIVVLTQGTAPSSADAFIGTVEAGGWDVTGTAKFTGVVPSTTVYFPPGQEEAARELARQFRIDRVKPSFKGITKSKIAVIVVQRPG
jgi:hypothetical protein